jgi:hypothetical protein
MECDFAITLPYKLRLQDNTSIVEDVGYYTPELRSIQDVGYYTPRGPNLSKLCATCLFLRVTDLGEATFIYLGYSPW